MTRFIYKYRFFFWGLFLNVIGLFTLYSALNYKGKVVYEMLLIKQMIWVLVAWMVFWITASLDYHYWKGVVVISYIFSTFLLLLVLVIGDVRYGAKRWINMGGFIFQPSELAKVSLVLTISYILSIPRKINGKWLVIGGILTLLPAMLIAIEPDLGTALTLVPITVAVFLSSGLSWRWIILGVFSGIASMPIVWHFLKDYQKQRVLVFLNPARDPLGAGYTVLQSRIAIGSGGIWGKGWLSGTQNKFNFLPERHTDFIFSVLAEEWGVVGSILIIFAFASLIGSALTLASNCHDRFAKHLSVAIGMYFFVHAFINIAMTCGFLPVVGLPLPFMSYGGTSLVMCYFLLGILQSIAKDVDKI